MSQTASLAAEIVAVRWRAEDGDFAVLAALCDDGEEVMLTGPIGHVREGETVVVEGEWREHPRFGRQLYCEHVRVGPAGEDSLLALLTSVKHVGLLGAQWLVDRHGPEVLEIVDRDPSARLLEVPGIGRARLAEAVASWQTELGGRALRLLLEDHGVPAAVYARVHKALGSSALSLLQEHPYALAGIEGIGFDTADAVARALGIEADAAERIDAGLVHTLRSAEQEGHCHLLREELMERAVRVLDLPPGPVAERIDQAELVRDGARILEPRMDYVERRLAARVRELMQAPPAFELDVPLRPPQGPDGPTERQWAAVRAVAQHRLSILTGLPGTGKTATMRALVELLGARRLSVRLCAPTGKAARRLSEATGGTEATTIHRLLEYVPGEGFTRDAEDPLTGADLLVVDEASMLDAHLAGALLSAVGDETHVLLVGDVDQLAPIGPGRVLEDLIDSGRVPATRLTEVFRQAERSLIIRAAHAIDRGERPPVWDPSSPIHHPDDVRDFFLIERERLPDAFQEVVSLAVSRLPSHYRLNPVADIQVLAPMHRGPTGVEALNAALRERLNPHGQPVRGTGLRVGDRIMQTRNNHERFFYNGEIGVVAAADADRETLTIAGDDGRVLTLRIAEAGTLRLAYACSVHKMQGSQAPAVIIALARSQAPMLTRNLLYTAVTRSQNVCVVVAERGALDLGLARVAASHRNTRLVELVGG